PEFNGSKPGTEWWRAGSNTTRACCSSRRCCWPPWCSSCSAEGRWRTCGWHWPRAPEPVTRASRSAPLASLYYTRLLHSLERRGFPKSDSQTPREFASTLAPANLAERVEQMTRLYEASRFGREPADARALAHCLGDIEACLRTTAR